MITPDRSKDEREMRKKLQDELKARKAAAESNLYIRNNKILKYDNQVATASFLKQPLTI